MTQSIFEAALNSDLAALTSFVDDGIDLESFDENGFTALHRVAISADSVANISDVLECMKCLLDAGSEIEKKSEDGRTALYLAAEFSETIEPVRFLVDAGAKADIKREDVHVVVNTRSKEAQQLLSQLSGYPVPTPLPPEPKSKRISASKWKELKPILDESFQQMTDSGLVALQDAGVTQSDAFSDCVEAFDDRTDTPVGFCFYTGQDLSRAKRTGKLLLGIWGAPDGSAAETSKVGHLAIDCLRNQGLKVRWDLDPAERPMVLLMG